jgi:hypothetical protein
MLISCAAATLPATQKAAKHPSVCTCLNKTALRPESFNENAKILSLHVAIQISYNLILYIAVHGAFISRSCGYTFWMEGRRQPWMICGLLNLILLGDGRRSISQTNGAPDQGQEPYSLRVSVNEVSLTFHVADDQGLPINDLKVDELNILDNGKAPRKILAFQLLQDFPIRRAFSWTQANPWSNIFRVIEQSQLSTLRSSYGSEPIKPLSWISAAYRKLYSLGPVTRPSSPQASTGCRRMGNAVLPAPPSSMRSTEHVFHPALF